MLTETWRTENDPSTKLDINGYQHIKSNTR